MRKSRLLFLLFGLSFNVNSKFIAPDKILLIVSKRCKKIDPFIVMGLIKRESSFRNIPSLVDTDSYGLMQVRITTAKWIKCGAKKINDLLNININISCGCSYLYRQIERYKGNYKKALGAYNSGTAFYNNGKLINIDYVRDILDYSNEFRKNYCRDRSIIELNRYCGFEK